MNAFIIKHSCRSSPITRVLEKSRKCHSSGSGQSVNMNMKRLFLKSVLRAWGSRDVIAAGERGLFDVRPRCPGLSPIIDQSILPGKRGPQSSHAFPPDSLRHCPQTASCWPTNWLSGYCEERPGGGFECQGFLTPQPHVCPVLKQHGIGRYFVLATRPSIMVLLLRMSV
jgi:hypothetical protein